MLVVFSLGFHVSSILRIHVLIFLSAYLILSNEKLVVTPVGSSFVLLICQNQYHLT